MVRAHEDIKVVHPKACRCDCLATPKAFTFSNTLHACKLNVQHLVLVWCMGMRRTKTLLLVSKHKVQVLDAHLTKKYWMQLNKLVYLVEQSLCLAFLAFLDVWLVEHAQGCELVTCMHHGA